MRSVRIFGYKSTEKLYPVPKDCVGKGEIMLKSEVRTLYAEEIKCLCDDRVLLCQ
jgi:hypothetical protein